MRNTRLTDKVKIVNAISPSTGAVGAASVNGTMIDGTGYSRVLWILNTGVAVATGTLDLSITAASSSGSTSYAAITTSTLTQLTSVGANLCYVIEHAVGPTKPYLKPVLTIGTACIANQLTAVLYRNEEYPISTTAYATQAIVE